MDDQMVQALTDSSLAIAGALVAALLILNAKSIINAFREAIAEFNRGRKQDADSLAVMQREFIQAGQEAIKQAVDIVARSADAATRRMEEMDRELREVRLDNERLKRDNADLRTKVEEQAKQIAEMTVKMGEDGNAKKRIRRARAGA